MRLNRRAFLKQASLLTASAVVLPNLLQAATTRPAAGLQLYTVRDLLEKDLAATL